jgi:hypothetical protein
MDRDISLALNMTNIPIVLGLSLTALLPAAAWYFIFPVYRFFALQGEKTGRPLGDGN